MSLHAKIPILIAVSCSKEPITIYEKIINHIKYDLVLVYIERDTFKLILKVSVYIQKSDYFGKL